MPYLMDSICQTEVSAERVAEFVDSISGEKATNRMVDHSVPVIKGENLAYASQNELFFSDSIKNNVALSESVDDRKLKQTFEKTSVDFLSGEHSPETQLDKKGQPLSGGLLWTRRQRQRCLKLSNAKRKNGLLFSLHMTGKRMKYVTECFKRTTTNSFLFTQHL
jgi:hypothetical protein